MPSRLATAPLVSRCTKRPCSFLADSSPHASYFVKITYDGDNDFGSVTSEAGRDGREREGRGAARSRQRARTLGGCRRSPRRSPSSLLTLPQVELEPDLAEVKAAVAATMAATTPRDQVAPTWSTRTAPTKAPQEHAHDGAWSKQSERVGSFHPRGKSEANPVRTWS